MERSTSPARISWPAATETPEMTPGIGAATCAGLPGSAFGRLARRAGAVRAVGHAGDARLAVQLEEDAHLAVLVGLADRLAADDSILPASSSTAISSPAGRP